MDIQKRKKTHMTSYNNKQKKRKQFSLDTGMTGFLCTCNFREKDCIRDAYKLLNEFADTIYGSNEEKEHVTNQNQYSPHDSDEEDISTALSKEINQLKAESDKPVRSRRFQVVDTGAKNVIFINSNVPDPLTLVNKIIMELHETKKQRTRFLLRLLPIEVVCKAYMNDIRLKANELLEKYFSQQPKTFSIVFNRHSNNSIQRRDVITDLAEIITKKNPGNKADLKNPEIAVVIEVIRGFCLISVVPDYYKYKKYNLLEICNVKEDINVKEGNLESNVQLEESVKTEKGQNNLDESTSLPVESLELSKDEEGNLESNVESEESGKTEKEQDNLDESTSLPVESLELSKVVEVRN